MDTKDIASLAAGLAAGTITESYVREVLGDDSLVDQVLSIAAGTAVASLVTNVVGDVVDDIFSIFD